VVRQFAYIHGVTRISLLSGKKYKVRLLFFLSHKNTTTTQTLITKIASGQVVKKSPIKNHATLFKSSWVIKPDLTKLDSTKPNTTQPNYKGNPQSQNNKVFELEIHSNLAQNMPTQTKI